MKKKFKLGKIQIAWVESLEKHPERQISSFLGKGTPKNYKACCLGELLLTSCRLQKKKLPFEAGYIKDINKYYLDMSYSKFGLRSHNGQLTKFYTINGVKKNSLSKFNDSDISWKDIAKFIRKHPETVFTKSV